MNLISLDPETEELLGLEGIMIIIVLTIKEDRSLFSGDKRSLPGIK